MTQRKITSRSIAANAITSDKIASGTTVSPSELTTQINNLIAGAPGALNTLDELAAALGDDASFATTITNSLATKANQSTTYTKTEVDTALNSKANTSSLAASATTDTTNASNISTGTLSNARLPSGTVRQIVSTTFKNSWQSTASGWLDVDGLSLSITTTTGKIFAIFSLHLDASSNNGVAGFRILRNGVADGNAIGINGVTGAWNSFGSGSDAQQFSPTFLDTGLSAGTYTYKVQVNRNSCSSISVNRFSNNDSFIGTNIAQSSITLIEIT